MCRARRNSPPPVETIGNVRTIAICADIHLGRGEAVTGFSGSDEDLASFLSQLALSADLVVVNGDLYDLDRGLVPCAQGREFDVVRGRWQRVESAMQTHGIRMTAGNHDRVLLGRSFAGQVVRERLVVHHGGRTLWIEHGERFDAWVKRVRWFTSLVTWVSGRVARGPLAPLYRALRWAETVTTQDDGGGLEARAERWFRTQSECDLWVFGHTHREAMVNVDGRWMLNPGEAMRAPFRFLRVDLEHNRVQFGSGDGRSALEYDRVLALDARV